MARFAPQSPLDARSSVGGLSAKTGIGWNRHGEALAASWGQSGESVAGERQTAGIAGKVVHSNTRIHRMILFINSIFIGIVKSK
jgi:hypothetical protein